MNSPSSPMGSPVSREAALRMAMAARALPDVSVQAFVRALGDRVGLPVTDEKLAQMTVADLKAMIQGDEIVEPDATPEALKQAVRYLWGEGLDEAAPKPDTLPPEASDEGLTVAVASNSGELLDGHFGSCQRFLVYRVSETGVWLLDVRSTRLTEEAEDKNAARAALIADCHIAYMHSIGGPAAAKVVRAGIHPVKYPSGGPARDILRRLQETLKKPPPWLAKVLGRQAHSLTRFSDALEAADTEDLS
jgi:nitrogen fixation protein NifX